ncbi:MAG: hypothetical protein ABJN42_07875 [Roseibium sp.]|uniref:hypothetical protein n=1 Tax=Roseibium sp. TaxID=1936156 RepID=UPI0032987793
MLKRAISFFLIAACWGAPGMTSAQSEDGPIHVYDQMFLELVGGVEGKSSYDQVTLRTRLQPPYPLSKMTIQEVIDFQQKVINSGASSSAMGKYQFIQQTLIWLVESNDISRHTVFTQATQDYLARILMIKCGFYERHESNDDIGNCLAKAWAGLPVMTGARKGKSYYRSNGNMSLTGPEAMNSVLSSRFSDPRRVRAAMEDVQRGRLSDSGTILISINN